MDRKHHFEKNMISGPRNPALESSPFFLKGTPQLRILCSSVTMPKNAMLPFRTSIGLGGSICVWCGDKWIHSWNIVSCKHTGLVTWCAWIASILFTGIVYRVLCFIKIMSIWISRYMVSYRLLNVPLYGCLLSQFVLCFAVVKCHRVYNNESTLHSHNDNRNTKFPRRQYCFLLKHY